MRQQEYTTEGLDGTLIGITYGNRDGASTSQTVTTSLSATGIFQLYVDGLFNTFAFGPSLTE